MDFDSINISRKNAIEKLGALVLGTAMPVSWKPESASPSINNFYIDVKDFGAKGDGKSDDTQALQHAINFAGNKKTELFIPAGVYIVSSTLNIPRDCPRVRGAGMGSNMLRRTQIIYSGNNACFFLGNTSNFTVISDVMIQTSSFNSNAQAIMFECTKLRFENLLIAGFGIGIGKTIKSTVFGIHFKGVELIACGFGIKLINTNNTTVSACFISSCDIGLYIDGGANHVVDNGSVIQVMGNENSKFRSGETNTSTNIVVKNAFAFSCICSYFESGSNSTTPTNQQIARVENTKGFTFSSNYCVSSRSESSLISPIKFEGANRSVRIDSNVFHRFPYDIIIIDGPAYTKEIENANKFAYVVENNTFDAKTIDINKVETISLCTDDEIQITGCSYKKNTLISSTSGDNVTIRGELLIESAINSIKDLQLRVGVLPIKYNHPKFNESLLSFLIIEGVPAVGELRYNARHLTLSRNNVDLKVGDVIGKTISFCVTYPFRF